VEAYSEDFIVLACTV